ncbi:MerR family transcriptional regulator [bacterium]|nr:MerR family transcriptional regulator [bacterium]
MKGPKIRRLYFTAKDVSEETGLTVQQLKSLELRFPQVKSIRHRTGRRLYKPDDLEKIIKITNFKSQGYTDVYIAQLLNEKVHAAHDRHKNLKLILIEIEEGLNEINFLLQTGVSPK